MSSFFPKRRSMQNGTPMVQGNNQNQHHLFNQNQANFQPSPMPVPMNSTTHPNYVQQPNFSQADSFQQVNHPDFNGRMQNYPINNQNDFQPGSSYSSESISMPNQPYNQVDQRFQPNATNFNPFDNPIQHGTGDFNPMSNQNPSTMPNYSNNPIPNQSFNQYQRNNRTQEAPPKENFIKKLLSKNEEPTFEYDPILGYRKLATKPESASILKKLAEPETLDYILSNTERVLQTAQQIGPLIDQYGPMVKSIPILLSSFTTDNKDSVITKVLKNNKNKKETIIEPEYEPVDSYEEKVPPRKKPSQSGPKLFV